MKLDQKVINIRKISLAIILVTIVISVVISYITSKMKYDFQNDIYEKYAIGKNAIAKFPKPSKTFWLAPILSFIFTFVFVGFAIMYAFNKNQKIQMRKWPYITNIVLGSISGIIVAFSLSKNHLVDLVDIKQSFKDSYPTQTADIQALSNKSAYNYLLYIPFIITIIKVALNSVCLWTISAQKNIISNIYSQGILNNK